MYGFMNWQWFEAQARKANRSVEVAPAAEESTPVGSRRLRLVSSAPSVSPDGACCARQELQLEPCYPYSSDWRLRCRGCGRWAAPAAVRREAVQEPISAIPSEADLLAAS
jgi:hypothetical protein